MIKSHSFVSVISTAPVVLDDDTLPGPYDPLEDDIVFATWFDLRPVVLPFSKRSPSEIKSWNQEGLS